MKRLAPGYYRLVVNDKVKIEVDFAGVSCWNVTIFTVVCEDYTNIECNNSFNTYSDARAFAEWQAKELNKE